MESDILVIDGKKFDSRLIMGTSLYPNLDVMNKLSKILIVKDAEIAKSNGLFSNKTFMFTGKLLNMSRSEAKSIIEQNSGSIVSNVTKKLDYLIVGEKSTNRKVEAAKKLKVKILDQSSWLKMLK